MSQAHCELGLIIKIQLHNIKKTQSWLATQCSVTKGHISHIIVGRCNPSIKMVECLSNALNIDCKILIDASLSELTKHSRV